MGMNRTAVADHIRDEFLQAVNLLGASVETMNQLAGKSNDPNLRGLFQRLGRAGRNVYFVKGIGLINIHVRSEPPGWWNILKTVKEDLDWLQNDLHIKAYYVLLIGRPDRYVANGYIASDFNFCPFVKHPGIEATKYSINEKQHLDTASILLSVERVAQELVQLNVQSLHDKQSLDRNSK
jgi:hypothetical protein